MMSLETAKKAIDFLIEKSGKRRNLNLDFFGGEPLMNWEVVKQTGRLREESRRSCTTSISCSPSPPTVSS